MYTVYYSDCFLPCNTMLARFMLLSCVCLSFVCPSIFYTLVAFCIFTVHDRRDCKFGRQVDYIPSLQMTNHSWKWSGHVPTVATINKNVEKYSWWKIEGQPTALARPLVLDCDTHSAIITLWLPGYAQTTVTRPSINKHHTLQYILNKFHTHWPWPLTETYDLDFQS